MGERSAVAKIQKQQSEPREPLPPAVEYLCREYGKVVRAILLREQEEREAEAAKAKQE